MEPTECSETSDFSIQTPGKYPEENIQYPQHGESFKTTTLIYLLIAHSLTYSEDGDGVICGSIPDGVIGIFQ
jgi:hypothetical protein